MDARKHTGDKPNTGNSRSKETETDPAAQMHSVCGSLCTALAEQGRHAAVATKGVTVRAAQTVHAMAFGREKRPCGWQNQEIRASLTVFGRKGDESAGVPLRTACRRSRCTRKHEEISASTEGTEDE